MTTNEYERLYDQIQEVTNNVINHCGFNKMEGVYDSKAEELMFKLESLATELADVAHELKEHFAWD